MRSKQYFTSIKNNPHEISTDPVLQFGVGLYALQLVSDNLPDLGTDTVVVILVHLLHAVVAAGICKVRDDGYRPVSLFLTLHFLGIDHNWMINGLI